MNIYNQSIVREKKLEKVVNDYLKCFGSTQVVFRERIDEDVLKYIGIPMSFANRMMDEKLKDHLTIGDLKNVLVRYNQEETKSMRLVRSKKRKVKREKNKEPNKA